MSLYNYGEAAIRVFHIAHRFLSENGICWLPVDIVGFTQEHWDFKWTHELAYEIGQTNDYICRHVCQSLDGATFYDTDTHKYRIVLNAEGVSQKRIIWSCAHEVGHIYLGHFNEYGASCLAKDKIPPELYKRLEFEADLFAGEVLASKWLMRDIDIIDENEIAKICGISDPAALSRYRKVMVDYSYIPINVLVTRKNFSQYMKEITVCMSAAELSERHIGDINGLARQNRPKDKLPTPKPKFIRKPGNCPYCDSFYSIEDAPYFCIRCGSPLKSDVKPGMNTCGCINPADVSYCRKCGKPVFRLRQGFCFEECEI